MSREPLILITRRGCHLCDQVRAPLAELTLELGLALRELDVDEDCALRERYSERVPVLLQSQTVLAEGRITADSVRRMLADQPGADPLALP